MSGKASSNRPGLLVGVLLLALLLLPLSASCGGKESSKGTPTATGTDLLLDPISTDAGYVSGTMVGEPGKEVRVY
jgi:hypothetical protein